VWSSAQTTPEPWAFYIGPGQPVIEGNGSSWHSDYPVVALFWPDRYYQVFLLLKREGPEYYCNVITPPFYDGRAGEVRFIDLDLDVYVDSDVRLLDEDEFERRRGKYPVEWAERATEAAAELVRLAERRAGPFQPAVAQWWRAWGTHSGR
jgi:protein associated with RNAse G/E